MNRKSLSALLKVNTNIEWRERRFDSNEFSAFWTPVLVYECSAGVEHRIGLTDCGVWSAEYSDNLHITNSDKYFAFVTVLEMQRGVFVSALKKCLSGLSLPEKIISTFPFDEVMLAAMKHGSRWAQLAEQWLESGYPLSPEIVIGFPEHVLVKREQKRRMKLITNA